MSRWREKWESAGNEPHLRPPEGGAFRPDPAEQRATPVEKTSELDRLRDSVRSEPSLRGSEAGRTDRRRNYGAWLQKHSARTSWGLSFLCVLLAGLCGGLFAVFGAFAVYFVASPATTIGVITIVIIAPVSEEILKQSGMVYLLEFKPFRVRARWQVFLGGFIAALVFATIENLLYIHVYVRPAEVDNFEAFVRYRWVVCTSLHVLCTLVTSIGLGLVWERIHRRHDPPDLQIAYPFFFIGMVLHGLYNLSVVLAESAGVPLF
ncbi:MAG: PrsW family glutamic-type intramembrane protease [Verrucomicrobiota bacterium]